MIGSCKIKDLLLQIFPSKGRESSGKEASAQEMGFRKGYWNIEFNDSMTSLNNQLTNSYQFYHPSPDLLTSFTSLNPGFHPRDNAHGHNVCPAVSPVDVAARAVEVEAHKRLLLRAYP